jgi:DNA-directed RNA polymerase subunit beta
MRVIDGIVHKKKVEYLSAEAEDDKTIAQANAAIDDKGSFENDRVKCRHQGDFPILEPGEIQYMDVAPNQIVGVSASLIPFLEHDDANRALMGSNMQRQAVPLLKPNSPIVGTGLEAKSAQDSKLLINAEGNGIVEYVDANQIHVRYDRSELDEIISFESAVKVYDLLKFKKTNQSTCINIKPIVKKGDKVKVGQVLCEGYGTQNGELALGQNLKVAFMPWKGYNFEDAIVISERIVREDIFTSLHIEEFELEVRDTKLGEEELTPDIPNVSEEATRNLDENGIIRVGAHIKEGDILIGKITPKGESDPTPEEKLLRAIFGDKAGDVKDASLKAPPSTTGVVIDKKLFSRAKKEKNAKVREKAALEKLETEFAAQLSDLQKQLVEKLLKLLKDKTSKGVQNYYKATVIAKCVKFTQKVLDGIDYQLIDP